MHRSNRRMAFALTALVAIMAFAPSKAMADPQGLFFRGQCGGGVVTDFVYEVNSQNRIQESDKVVKATLPPSGPDELSGGLVVKVVALKPAQYVGGGWQNLSFRADTGNVPTNAVFAILHFDEDKMLPVSLNTFPGNPGAQAGWRTFSIDNTIDGGKWKNSLLRRVDLIVHSYNLNSARIVKFGKVVVNHYNQGNINDGELMLFQTKPTCGETGL